MKLLRSVRKSLLNDRIVSFYASKHRLVQANWNAFKPFAGFNRQKNEETGFLNPHFFVKIHTENRFDFWLHMANSKTYDLKKRDIISLCYAIFLR